MQKKKKNIGVIIVAVPGTWQKMLMRNLASQPSVDTLAVAHGSLSAMQLAEEHDPDLILIDSSIPTDDAVALIEKLKREKPQTKSIVLTDTSHQGRRYKLAGADYTLPIFNFVSQIKEIFDNLNEDQDNLNAFYSTRTAQDEDSSAEI